MSGRLLSVVVPTLDEAPGIGALLASLDALRRRRGRLDVVVADGGSTDETVAIAARAGARVVRAARGRGVQLAAGAAEARGDWLAFLHADVRLSDAALAAIAGAPEAADDRTAWWLRLRVAAEGFGYRVVERSANWRSRRLGLPYGDQGLVVSRAHYEAAGGFDAVPLMEDVALVRRLALTGRLRELDASIEVSARRWQRDGLARRTLRNWVLLAAWLAGAPPERLAERYR